MMRDDVGWLPRLTCLAIAVIALCAGLATAQEDIKKLPSFAATGVHGMPETKRPLDVVGGRLIVLTFIAPWSDRCIEEVKHLNKLHDKHSGRGMTILAIAEADIATLKAWAEEHGARFPFAAVDTKTYESVAELANVPGLPHAVMIEPGGEICWSGHPREVKKQPLSERMVGILAPPPRLPEALVEQEKLLVDGRWGAARTSLIEANESLDKISKGWASGLVAWVEERRGTWLSEADAHMADGRHWDAWEMYEDFPRRFEGLPGADEATAAAKAIRADPAAKRDLEAGDLVQKGRERIAEGDNKRAALILKRVVRTFKGSPHAERAKELLKSVQ